MTFEISEYKYVKECKDIAEDAVDRFLSLGEDNEDAHYIIDQYVWEAVDGHQWVIYHYKSLMICAHCDVSLGEDFLEEIGPPKDPTIYTLASIIVFGDMRARVVQYALDLLEQKEEEN